MSRPILKFVTGNSHKLREVRQIIGKFYEIDNFDIDLPEYQGEPDYIIKKKLEDAVKAVFSSNINLDNVKGVIVEDTCLCYNAIGGLPGPYVKHFLKNAGLHNLVKILEGFQDKTAYALCTFSLALFEPDGSVKTTIFQGKINGNIVYPKGSQDFGWDAIFQPEEYNETFAEMNSEKKNAISHRSLALIKLKDYLNLL